MNSKSWRRKAPNTNCYSTRRLLQKRLTSLSLSESLICWAMKRTLWIAASTSDVSVRGIIICSPSVKGKENFSKVLREKSDDTCLADDADSDGPCCRIRHDYPCTRLDTRWCCLCSDLWGKGTTQICSHVPRKCDEFTSCQPRWCELSRRSLEVCIWCGASLKRAAWIGGINASRAVT